MATVFTIKRRPTQAPAAPGLLLCQGNALHLPLQDNSINCCVTSPPYYGLRDYQTGTWSGGDPACTHTRRTSLKEAAITTESRPTNTNHEREGWKGGVCGRCGAVRADGQLGLEESPDSYVRVMAQVFREVKRVLRPDGLLFLNIGDSFASSGGPEPAQTKWQVDGASHTQNGGRSRQPPGRLPAKNLLGMPWRVALALQRSGWILRSEIIWEKTNAMPESVKDRPTKSHEQVFLFSKREHYFYDQEAIKEPAKDWGTRDRSRSKYNTNGYQEAGQTPHGGFTNGNQAKTGRNARSVWTFPTQPFKGAHFATFPAELVRRCLLAGVPTKVCTTCGAPWVRQTTSRLIVQYASRHGGYHARGDSTGMVDMSKTWCPGTKETTTLGFVPTCLCLGGVGQATVLDIFCGSGTTLLVARELGHHAIGIDLSWNYLDTIARRRLGQVLNL